MYYPSVDYTAEEITNAVIILEQYLPHEKNPDVHVAIQRSLAVMRAVGKIRRGTKWLSELSGT